MRVDFDTIRRFGITCARGRLHTAQCQVECLLLDASVHWLSLDQHVPEAEQPTYFPPKSCHFGCYHYCCLAEPSFTWGQSAGHSGEPCGIHGYTLLYHIGRSCSNIFSWLGICCTDVYAGFVSKVSTSGDRTENARLPTM
jgi:hypothetical protein